MNYISFIPISVSGSPCTVPVFPDNLVRNNSSSNPVGSTFITQGDYTSVNFLNEPFRGRPFNTNNRRQCFSVTIVNDDIPENAESFTVTIEQDVPSPSVIVQPDVATITILDIVLGFEQTVFRVNEEVGVVELCVNIFEPPNLGASISDIFLVTRTQDGTTGIIYTTVHHFTLVSISRILFVGLAASITIDSVITSQIKQAHTILHCKVTLRCTLVCSSVLYSREILPLRAMLYL